MQHGAIRIAEQHEICSIVGSGIPSRNAQLDHGAARHLKVDQVELVDAGNRKIKGAQRCAWTPSARHFNLKILIVPANV